MKTINRRNLIKTSFLSTAALIATPSFLQAAENCALLKTPPQTKGPFYPVVDQVDTDADLVQVKDAVKAALGKVVLIEGTVTDQHCQAVQGALVEIWQACQSGRYNHPSDTNTAPLDPNFQYWGKAVTDHLGRYKFRTIIPGAYPAETNWIRPPHIHFKIARLGYIELITQMYFSGEVLNQKDLILQRLEKSDQEKVIIEFKDIENAKHPVGIFNIQIEKI